MNRHLVIPKKTQLEQLYLAEKRNSCEIGQDLGLPSTLIYSLLRKYKIPRRRGGGRLANIYRTYMPSRLIRGELSDFERGYACGMLDGEGSVGITRQKRHRDQFTLRPFIYITNTNWAVMERLRAALGGGVNTTRGNGKNIQEKYVLRIYNMKSVYETLSVLLAGLTIKPTQAVLVMEFCKSRLNGAIEQGLGYTKRELEIFALVRELNRKSGRLGSHLLGG